jgi:CO/xanthine dehydrogenase FAD-binding subunit
VIASPRVALGGCGPRPRRAPSAEAALVGRPLGPEAVQAAAEAVGRDAQPFDDALASAWYRARVLPVHFRRALLGA